MPLPKKNNLLESNRNKMEEDIACKKFLEQIKEGDGIHKKPIKEKNIKAYNYIIDNKKKIKKDSSKRKKSAKTRENENKKLVKPEEITQSIPANKIKSAIHRKSYSEVVRDINKKKFEKVVKDDKKLKEVPLNIQSKENQRSHSEKQVNSNIDPKNIYNFNIQNLQLVNSKNTSIQYFSNNKTGEADPSAAQANLNKKKKEIAEKGLKKFSQGYTINKLTKEAMYKPNKTESYVKVIKTKSKTKRPSSSKKRKAATGEQRYSANYDNLNKTGLSGSSVGLYNGNYGERNSCFINQNMLSINIGGGTFNNSTKAKENYLITRKKENILSNTIGGDSFKNNNLGGIKPNAANEKIGSLKKAGPIKATVSTDKVKINRLDNSNNQEKQLELQKKKVLKETVRERRPHSSTFIGHNQKEIDMYSKVMVPAKTKPKVGPKPECKEQSKKKSGKRVRSASPGTLKNYLTQKQTTLGSKLKPQRVIGGNLYQPNANAFSTSTQIIKDKGDKQTASKNIFSKGTSAEN